MWTTKEEAIEEAMAAFGIDRDEAEAMFADFEKGWGM